MAGGPGDPYSLGERAGRQQAYTVIADEFEELARDCSGGYPTAREQLDELRRKLERHGHLLRYGLDGIAFKVKE